ncbi:unnamed protein product [Mytilus edulis]|uniref:Uncharacterized protein n=1 Tax=Mytilus edulis TaxID=6550 RepID=A0A8S3Q1F3_MYTED|nr:unnamed protein product [Mytilus edulis]
MVANDTEPQFYIIADSSITGIGFDLHLHQLDGPPRLYQNVKQEFEPIPGPQGIRSTVPKEVHVQVDETNGEDMTETGEIVSIFLVTKWRKENFKQSEVSEECLLAYSVILEKAIQARLSSNNIISIPFPTNLFKFLFGPYNSQLVNKDDFKGLPLSPHWFLKLNVNSQGTKLEFPVQVKSVFGTVKIKHIRNLSEDNTFVDLIEVHADSSEFGIDDQEETINEPLEKFESSPSPYGICSTVPREVQVQVEETNEEDVTETGEIVSVTLVTTRNYVTVKDFLEIKDDHRKLQRRVRELEKLIKKKSTYQTKQTRIPVEPVVMPIASTPESPSRLIVEPIQPIHNFIFGLSLFLDTVLVVCNDKRHVMFASPNQFHILQQDKQWFCDGTFKNLADPLAQLWSIHAFTHMLQTETTSFLPDVQT